MSSELQDAAILNKVTGQKGYAIFDINWMYRDYGSGYHINEYDPRGDLRKVFLTKESALKAKRILDIRKAREVRFGEHCVSRECLNKDHPIFKKLGIDNRIPAIEKLDNISVSTEDIEILLDLFNLTFYEVVEVDVDL